MLDICDQCGSSVSKKLLRCSDRTAVFHRECPNGHKVHRTTSQEDQPTTDSHRSASYVIVEACDCV
jgi:phage FluMu protein Com